MFFKNVSVRYGYFDYASFTPLSRVAYKKLKEVYTLQKKGLVGNPLSNHSTGKWAEGLINNAREKIATSVGIKSRNILFTKGATSGIRLGIRSIIETAREAGIDYRDMNFVVGQTEHDCVSRPLKTMSRLGVDIRMVRSDKNGLITKEGVLALVDENTVGVSVQYVNSEYGLIQPVKEIFTAVKEKNKNAFTITDAAQAVAYFNISPYALNADIVVVDGIKMFGPQGVGFNIYKSIDDFFGLSGEKSIWDLNPGTPPVAMIAACAEAFDFCIKNREKHVKKLKELQSFIFEEIDKVLPDCKIHGIGKVFKDIKTKDYNKLTPHIIHINLGNVNYDYLFTLLDSKGFYVSQKAACLNKHGGESFIDDLGEDADGIRISFCPYVSKRSLKDLIFNINKLSALAQK